MNKIPRSEKGFSILEGIFIIIVVLVIGVVGTIVYGFHAASSLCGPNSPNHKSEQAKVAIFNTVSFLPSQPNQQSGIYDSTQGQCNLDVAQSYSATKSYAVNMNGANALSTVTETLHKQGFTLTKSSYGRDYCNNISAAANFSGKSIIITVGFGKQTQHCQNPTPFNAYNPSAYKSQFDNSTVTSIDATVSTPDRTSL